MKSMLALSLLAGADAAETVLGAFIFHRHGDRTPKALAPTNLTTLGYDQVYTSGQYYRSRYLSDASDARIHGISQDTAALAQLAVTAPVDNVLQTSAMGFLQGLYPPVRTVQTLASGRDIQAPMDGYQLIPVNTIETGAGSEDAGWLQDASSCANAKTSSNSYFKSAEYESLASSSKDLFDGLVPFVQGVLTPDQVNYKNAYIVYDLLNVARIHNSTTNDETPDNTTFADLTSLAYKHEWALAYNATDLARAIPGMQLAGEVLSHLNTTVTARGTTRKLGIQFGAYATALSFFGLADLDDTDANFRNVIDYASSLVFELFTTDGSIKDGEWPASEDDLHVRFLFHNGAASNSSSTDAAPTPYPLFRTNRLALPYKDFKSRMASIAIQNSRQWCDMCGSQAGACAAFTTSVAKPADAGSKSALSPTVAGVVGALVTLAVLLGCAALAMLVAGLRVVKVGKKKGELAVADGKGEKA